MKKEYRITSEGYYVELLRIAMGNDLKMSEVLRRLILIANSAPHAIRELIPSVYSRDRRPSTSIIKRITTG